MLEEQAEHLTVTSDGDFKRRLDRPHVKLVILSVSMAMRSIDGIDSIGDGKDMWVFEPADITVLELDLGID